jgi:hypothetical protein
MGSRKLLLHLRAQTLEYKVIYAERVDKEMLQGVLGAVISAHKANNTNDNSEPVTAAVTDVLQGFQDVFLEPTQLPPARDCDHQIALHPGTKPVNKRAYRLPAYQKDALEKIIDQLIKSKVIRISLSPFSSPANLLRKKGWKLEVVHRLQTVKC